MKNILKYFLIAIVLIIVVLAIFGALIFENIREKNSDDSENFKIVEQGLGDLCSDEKSCISFCLNSRARCEDYCNKNNNELCDKIFHEKMTNPYRANILPEPLNENQFLPPVLENLPFSIESWNKETNLAGDIIFTKKLLLDDGNIFNDRPFLDFGFVGGRRTGPQKNIELWFFVPLNTKVHAPVDGKVEVSKIEHSNDWGVIFMSDERSPWRVDVEHVVNVSVKTGDIVKAGDIVAEASPRNSFNYEISMTELGIWDSRTRQRICPFFFLDDKIKPVYTQKLNRLASDWELFLGKDVYQQEKWIAPGCLEQNITEGE